MFLDPDCEAEYILEVELGIQQPEHRTALLGRFRQMLRAHAMHGATPPSPHLPAAVLDDLPDADEVNATGARVPAVRNANALYDAAQLAGAVGRNLLQFSYAHPHDVTTEEVADMFTSQPFVAAAVLEVAARIKVRVRRAPSRVFAVALCGLHAHHCCEVAVTAACPSGGFHEPRSRRCRQWRRRWRRSDQRQQRR